jgi:hypothetical protein
VLLATKITSALGDSGIASWYRQPVAMSAIGRPLLEKREKWRTLSLFGVTVWKQQVIFAALKWPTRQL